MKTVEITSINGKEIYYVNEVPNTKYEAELCEKTIKLFNSKYVDEFTLGFAGDLDKFTYSNKIIQPDFWTISTALLWGYGDYKIKQGCFTNGTGYVSSFTIPNDDDKDVVLIKKWGKNLEDVYIYINDIELLIEATETKTQKAKRISLDFCHIFKSMCRLFIKESDNKKDLYVDVFKSLSFDKRYKDSKDLSTFRTFASIIYTYDKTIVLKELEKFRTKVFKNIKDYENYKEVYVPYDGLEDNIKRQLHCCELRLELINILVEFYK